MVTKKRQYHIKDKNELSVMRRKQAKDFNPKIAREHHEAHTKYNENLTIEDIEDIPGLEILNDED